MKLFCPKWVGIDPQKGTRFFKWDLSVFKWDLGENAFLLKAAAAGVPPPNEDVFEEIESRRFRI